MILRILGVNLLVFVSTFLVFALLAELFLPEKYSKEYQTQIEKLNNLNNESRTMIDVALQNVMQGSKDEDIARLTWYYKMTKDVAIQNKKTSRILIIGDSFIAGDGVTKYSTWDAIFIHFYDAINLGLNQKVEIISFGLSGRNTQQQYEYLKLNLDTINPDLVIFSYVSNDPHIRSNKEVAKKFYKVFSKVYPYKTQNYIKEKSQVLYELYDSSYGTLGWLEQVHSEENWPLYNEVINDLKKFLNKNEKPFIFFAPVHPSYALTKQYETQVSQTFKKHKIPFITANPSFQNNFSNIPISEQYAVTNHNGHPNVLLNKFSALYLLSKICSFDFKQSLNLGCSSRFKTRILNSLSKSNIQLD